MPRGKPSLSPCEAGFSSPWRRGRRGITPAPGSIYEIAVSHSTPSGCHAAHIQWYCGFDWYKSNLRKIRAHRIKPEEVEKALSSNPILIYEQDVQGEARYVYYGETASGRLLAVVLVERDEKIRGRHRVRPGRRAKEGLPGPPGTRGVKL